MKLISCYIENFGKLHQFSYDFSEGLNVICEKNGWGKSTLAVFLKAMLYGMEYTTKHKLDDNERKKYLPWNGGAYGGNLVFEADGKVYRAERFWGAKDKEDVFKIYDENTGLESGDYTEKLGEELFGIDKTAFEQSIFMKQGLPAISMTDSIATKMSGLMASGDDIDCYAKACDRLENEMKIYKSKKTENKGKIAELTGEIYELGRRITEAKRTGTALKDWKAKAAQCNAEIKKLKMQRTDLKEQMRKTGEIAALREKQKHYQLIADEKDNLRRSLEELDHFFRKGFPEEEELEQYRNKLYAYKSEMPKEELAEQKYKYPNLADILERYPISEEELDACERKWQSLQESEKLLEQKEMQLRKLHLSEVEREGYVKAEQRKVKNSRTVWMISAVVLLVLAAVMFLMRQWGYGYVAVGLLFLAIVACIIQQKRFRTIGSEADEELLRVEEDFEALNKTIEKGKKAMRMYLQPYLLGNLEDVPMLLSQIRITLMELNARQEHKIRQKEAEDRRIKEKRVLREELILFLRKFYGEAAEVEDFLFKEIIQKRNEYIGLSKQYEDKCKQLAQTERVEEVPEGKVMSLEELQQKEEAIENSIHTNEEYLRQVNANISKYMSLLEDCEKWEMEKQDMEELLEECQTKYTLLEKTLQYLQTAQAEFSSRYLKKINEGYRKYAEIVNEDSLNHSAMDLKLAMKTDEGGTKRDLAYFSRGTKEAMELCSRFALVDALFEQETPFVVLDDPFVNFDERTMAGGMRALEKIAQKYQLIYFTCHSSRK